ncbi:serine/threonine protein kinase [Corallococcus coralloides]|uniref:Serine/threonine protein kinase n=1 Tax=Corallococcus coralloides TaxID=184914 RepID=A0A410RSJ1_CORCK|nr:serine/threonine-protein kinase [Corallococcus coralloides]QAT84832.1 serine/threonine protein kinase [Corallococcus coralloides]
MKLPKRKGRLFRLPFADAPESRARLWKSMTEHGLFVPEDTPQPIGTEFALQVAFQGDGPAVSGRVRVMEHGVSGWVRGYFVKFVALDAGSLPLPLSPREPLAPAAVGTPAAGTAAGVPGGNAASWREEPTPVGIRPRSTVGGASALNDYSHLELLHARDPEAWQGGLRPFDAFGPYQLLQRLGTGGMAEVILARRTMAEGVDKLVALKLVFQEYARHPRLSELFLTEARLSATLQHPNVIQVFDVGSAAGRPFMAMEYVHGRNGADLVQALRQRGRPPPVALAVTVAIELGKALEYLHGQRDLDGRPLHLVHRDVSPGNLLVGLHGEVKLVDMGVASASIASGNDLLVVGKRAYMAPEQIAGGRPEPAWDIHGMGLVLHELLTLHRASETASGTEGPAGLLKPSHFNSQVTPELERLVQWATAPDPSSRAPSAKVLRHALERVRGALPPFDLVQTMHELFGEALDRGRRETEVLMGAARGKDRPHAFPRYRRWRNAVEQRIPVAAKLAVARHGIALRWSALVLTVLCATGAALMCPLRAREAELGGHLSRADRLIAVAKLSGAGEDTALAQLQAARALRPEDPRVRSRLAALADAFERLAAEATQRGDVTEAMAHLRAALEAAPERSATRVRLRLLEEELRKTPSGWRVR